MPNSNSIISVKNVGRSYRSTVKKEGFAEALKLLFKPEYKEHEALKNVSFEIESGSFVGLIGANGAGKTTLLKILSGLIAPTSGSARVLGVDPFTRPLQFRQQIALVMGQKAQLWWDLPAVDAFDLLRSIYEIPMPVYKERLNELAKILDVDKHLGTQIRRLSLGERMKMELIGAILHWPKVIFLDEPTIGLDVLAAHKLREFLRVFNEKQKATIILTSHNMDDIERLCSRVLILRSGQMIFDGKPTGLTNSGERRLRVQLSPHPEKSVLSLETGIDEKLIVEEHEPETESTLFYFSLQQNQIVDVLQRLMKKYTISSMGIEESNLEAVIQRLWEHK